MAYSNDLRKRVIEYVLSGGRKTDAAKRFDVHRQTVQKWIRNYKLNAKIPVAKKTGPKSSRKLSEKKLLQVISTQPDATLKELALEFSVHYSTIFYALKKLGISRKKNMGL